MDYESDSRDGVQPRMIAVPAAEWERVNKQRDLARAALEKVDILLMPPVETRNIEAWMTVRAEVKAALAAMEVKP